MRAQIFNILCEQPETVAVFLVPRARTVAARGESGRYIRFLTLPRALIRFITAPLRANRFFSADGASLPPHRLSSDPFAASAVWLQGAELASERMRSCSRDSNSTRAACE